MCFALIRRSGIVLLRAESDARSWYFFHAGALYSIPHHQQRIEQSGPRQTRRAVLSLRKEGYGLR